MSPSQTEGLSSQQIRNEKAPAVAAAQGFGSSLSRSTRPDFEPAANQPQEPYGKRLTRLCAEYASAGWQMHPLQAGSVVVAFMGAHRVLDDLDAAERMLSRIKGAHRG